MYNTIRPGKFWYDTEGKRIQAHGGSLLYANEKYYWYGENNPTDFVNGGTYDINNIELSTDTRGKTKIVYEDTYSELFLELMTEDEKFSDITLQSDTIKYM